MVFTPEIVTGATYAVVTLGGMVPIISKIVKKYGPKVEQVVQKDASVIADLANAAERGIEHLLSLPELAVVKAKLEAAEKAARDSQLATIARGVLHGYEKALGVLTPNEKATLVAYIHAELAKVGQSATDAEILAALNEAQQIADAFKQSAAYQHTAQLQQSLQALAQATQQQPQATA